jgi:hypothetical protein
LEIEYRLLEIFEKDSGLAQISPAARLGDLLTPPIRR